MDRKNLVQGLKSKITSRFLSRDKSEENKPAEAEGNASADDAKDGAEAKGKLFSGLKDKVTSRLFNKEDKDMTEDKVQEEKPEAVTEQAASPANAASASADAASASADAAGASAAATEEDEPKGLKDKITSCLFSRGSKDEDKEQDKAEEEKPEEKPVPEVHHAIFRGLAKIAPLSLLILLAMVCWMPLLTTDLLCPAEADNARVLLAGQGISLLPHAGGHVLMPAYALLCSALASLHLATPVQFLPLAGFAGAAVCLIGLCILAATLKMGRHVMFGAGLLLLCLPVFLGMANFVGPIPFACGISMIAMALLCRAWMKESDLPGMVLGSLVAVCATLSGGLYFGLVPVASGFLFAMWRGSLARLRQKDALAGFIVFIVAHLLWLGALIILKDDTVTSDMLLAGLLGIPYPAVFCDSLTKICLGFLPFLLILLALSWPQIFKNLAKGIKASRKENGSAYLWIAIVLSFVFSCFAAHAFDVFLTLCLLSLLAARALLRLSVFGVRSFFILTGVLLLGVTLGLLALVVPFFNELAVSICPQFAALVPADVHADLERLWSAHAVISLFVCFMPLLSALVITHVAWRSRTAAAPLLTSIACIVVLAQPVGLYCMPQIATQMASAKLLDANALLEEKNDTAAEPLVAPKEQPSQPADTATPAEPAAPAEQAKPEEAKPAEQGASAVQAKPEEVQPAEQGASSVQAKPDEVQPAEQGASAVQARPEEVQPAEQGASAVQAKPEEAKPAEPVAPAEQAKPEEVKPAEPAAPAEQAKPDEAKPAEPAAPAEQAKPDEAKPAEPAAPAVEAKPDEAKPQEAQPAEDNREAGTI